MIVYDGLTNLTWFMGIVEDNVDPLKAGRVKIRAFGFHPTIEEDTVDSKDLPWAPVLSGGIHMYVPIDNGELVFGAFLDGRDAQQPLVFGVIPTAKFAIPVTSRGTGGGAADSGQVGSSAVASNYSASTPQEAFLDAIAVKESGGAYDVRNGGSTFDITQGHPGRDAGPNGTSSASGRYQFTYDTWLELNDGVNVPMTPENQDAAAWKLADQRYSTYTGGNDLNSYIETNGVTTDLLNTLSPTWAAFGIPSNQQLIINTYNTSLANGLAAGPAGAPVPVTNPHLLNSPEVITNFGNLALPPQATGEHQHKTPYAAAVTAASANHPGISFGGSHKTGVWNARYDGSYIELHAGTNSHEEHINLVHRRGTSISMDAQGNISIKSTGRVHIESDNNIDTNADGYTTNLSKGGHEIFVDGGDLILKASGDIKLNSNSNIYLGAGKDIFMTSGGSVGISTKTMGITTDGGPINILSGQTIAIQSAAEIMAKAANMSMRINGKLGIESTGDMTIKGDNMSIGSSGYFNQKSSSAVIDTGSIGIKTSGGAIIDAGGAVYIDGDTVNLKSGGSVNEINIPDVTDIADVPGAIPPKDKDGKETADASPPPLGTSAKAKPKNPTPPPITSNSVDDVISA